MNNIRRTHGFEQLQVEGNIPSDLRGTLFRAGPGLFERFGQKIHHPFEADGLVSAVRFDEQGVEGAARIVESAGYKKEEEAGKFLYNSSANFWDFLKVSKAGEAKTSGNTSTFFWQNRLFALMEGGKPQEMDPLTLDTWQDVDLGGVIHGAFSAHPHYVSALDTHFNFGVRYGRHMSIDMYALPANGAARHLGSFDAPWASLIHDFAATEKHLIFIIAPARLVTWRALTRVGGLSKLFQWNPKMGCQIVRVPLNDPTKIERFELDAFWLWHTVNAFESREGTVVDLCAYTKPDFEYIGNDKPDAPRPYLERLVLSAQGARRERLWDVPCEFPSIPSPLHGQHYERAFFQVEREGAHGLAAYNLTTKEENFWLTPEGHRPSEPVFVPGKHSPLHGWMLSLVNAPEESRSYLAILDGDCIEQGPVARIWFDQEIGLTFHGTWVPEESLSAAC